MNTKYKPRKRHFFIKFLLVILIFIGWLYWGNHTIETTVYEIISDKLDPEGSEITIVHISDLHNAEFGEKQERLVAKVKAASPDFIVITGDLIDVNHTDVEKAMAFIRGAVSIAPIYFITGNHEAGAGKDYITLSQEMALAGVNIMDNQSDRLLSVNGQSIYLMGREEPAFGYRSEYKFDHNIFTVMLSHHAEHFRQYVEVEVDLALTGHMHGGQFRLPFIGGLIAPGNILLPKYTSGVYQENNTRMVVNRGLGNSRIPIRFNNPPEIVVVRLIPE